MSVGKKTLGGGAVIVVAAVVAGYLLFLSPKSTTLRAVVAHQSMASTDQEAVAGSVSPAKAGRLVLVEARGDGDWSEVARTTTDATGAYKVSFALANRGEHQIRVRVEKDGRQKSAVSEPSHVTVLNPTQLQVDIPRSARTDRPLRVSGRVAPAAVRDISVEQSMDGQTWISAGRGTTQANGQFTLAATGFNAGNTQLRVAVEASGTEAAATSGATSVNVEDYKAAGQQYLQIVAKMNNLIDQYNKLTTQFDTARALARKMSVESTREARRLRSYAYWPQEVKDAVEVLAKADTLWADYYNQLANTKSNSEFLALQQPQLSKAQQNAPVVIRAALGLPKRD